MARRRTLRKKRKTYRKSRNMKMKKNKMTYRKTRKMRGGSNTEILSILDKLITSIPTEQYEKMTNEIKADKNVAFNTKNIRDILNNLIAKYQINLTERDILLLNYLEYKKDLAQIETLLTVHEEPPHEYD